MPTVNFTNGTVITSTWLNDVDQTVFNSVNANDSAYGADPTGAVDSTTALEAAAAAAALAGKILLLPAGSEYLISSEFTVSQAGLLISARGAKLTKDATFTGSAVIRVTGLNVHIDGLEIDGVDYADDGILTSSGNGDGLTVTNCTIYSCLYGVSAMSTKDVRIEGNTITDCASSCLRIHNNTSRQSLKNWRVIRNTFDQSARDPATHSQANVICRGDETYPPEDVLVDGNRFIMAQSPTNSAFMGIEVRWSKGVRVVNNYAKYGGMMVSIAGCDGTAVTSNTGFGQNFWSIEIAGPVSGTTASSYTTVTGNTIDGEGLCLTGIGLQGSASPVAGSCCVVSGNTIRRIVNTGISINATWDRVVIGSNIIECSDYTSTQRAIWCLAVANEIVINVGVIVGDGVAERAIQMNNTDGWIITGGVISNFPEGINLLADTAASNNNGIISDVVFRTVTTPIATSGAGTLGTNVQVRSCPGYVRSGALGVDVLDYVNDVIDAWGSATPVSNVTAGVGSVYRSRAGGSSTTFFVKESGSGTSGWVGK